MNARGIRRVRVYDAVAGRPPIRSRPDMVPSAPPWTRYASPSTSARCTGHRTGIGSAVAGIVGAAQRLGRGRRRSTPYVAELPGQAGATRQRRLPLPAAVAHRAVVARRSTAASTGGSAGADVVHGTNYVVPPSRAPDRRVGVRLLVPRPPCARHRRRPPRRRGAAPARAAEGTVRRHLVERHDGQGPRAARATDRVEVVHLGPLADPADRRPMTDRPACPTSTARRSCSRSARSSGARTCRRWSPRSDASPTSTATLRSSSPAPPGDDAARRRRRRSGVLDSGRGLARSCSRAGRRRRPRAGCCTTPRALAYPSLDEGFGFPILEAQQRGTPVVASTRRFDPRDRRRRRRAESPSSDADALAAALDCVVDERRHAATSSSRPAAPTSRRFSWSRHR